ncbi:hypothetical protein CDD83_3933 [Cordyceps sp. RAO-2017]|nr:hypothetical protein CDD83_3933 [Cordyceps sp. RAO-2017]
MDEAVAGGTPAAGWPVDNVSFSLAVVARDQAAAGVPLWEYHHLAANNVRGTHQLGRDSQYLVGSVSKVVSDYILLKSPVDLDAPVTAYLPELADASPPPERLRWHDVTLRMLATQLSGAPTNYGFSEYYSLKNAFLSYGFPPIRDSAYPPCGVGALNGPCSQQAFLRGMVNSYPVAAPMERAAYSNVAFTLLITAVERVTGKNYTQLVDDVVARPLRLRSTMPSPGDDWRAVIPPGDSSWGADFGLNTPGGGLVSSLADLSSIAHAVLARSIDLTPTQVRQWLKPQAYTGGSSAVGMPWEMFRAPSLTPGHPHPVTVHGKGGAAQAYRCQFSLVDEYGLGLIVLAAGPANVAISLLADALLATFVPAADKASRIQAGEQYARTFETDCGAVELEATFALDRDSLRIASMHRNGSDILGALAKIWFQTMGQFTAEELSATVRLFPADLDEETTLHGRPVTREVWRLWLQPGPASQRVKSPLPSSGTLADNCFAWTLADWVHYGSEPLDRVLFYKDGRGHVVGFEAPFLRSGVLPPATDSPCGVADSRPCVKA